MIDLIMLGILAGCFALVKRFADFCEGQVEPKDRKQ